MRQFALEEAAPIGTWVRYRANLNGQLASVHHEIRNCLRIWLPSLQGYVYARPCEVILL